MALSENQRLLEAQVYDLNALLKDSKETHSKAVETNKLVTIELANVSTKNEKLSVTSESKQAEITSLGNLHAAEVRELTAKSADLRSNLKLAEAETQTLVCNLESSEKQLNDLSILLGNSEEVLFQQRCENQSLLAELSRMHVSGYELLK